MASKYDEMLRHLVEPIPFFNTLLDTYFPVEFLDEVLEHQGSINRIKSNINQDKIKEILITHAQKFEKFFLSYMHIYNNLFKVLESKFDMKIANNTSFHMEPLTGEEKTYVDVSIFSDNISEVPPDRLTSHVHSSPKIRPEEYPTLLSFALSKDQYPNTKLHTIQKFLEIELDLKCQNQYYTIACENGGKQTVIQQVAEFENVLLDKWQTYFPIDFSSSPTHTFHVDSYQKDKYEHYILFDNTEGRYIFNITEQNYYFNGNLHKISEIYDHNLLNMTILYGKLVFIGSNANNKIFITKFKTDKPSLNEIDTTNEIDSEIHPGNFNCNIIENNLHLYSKNDNIHVYDLVNMTYIDDPEKYIFLCHANFFPGRICTASYDGTKIFSEVRNIPVRGMYTTIIQPTATQHSQVAICMIASEMINAITRVYEIIIEGKNTDNSYAFQCLNHIDFGYELFKKLQLSKKLPQRIIDFVNILILRFVVLNVRQLASANPNIDPQRQKMITEIFESFKDYSLLFRESVDMIFKSVKIGIYYPAIITIINKVFCGSRRESDDVPSYEYLNENPQNIFVKQLNFNDNFINQLNRKAIKDLMNYYKTCLINMHYLVKKNKSVSYDTEFIPIVDSMFELLTILCDENHFNSAKKLFKNILKYFAVIPVGFYLANRILEHFKNIDPELFEYIKNKNEFKLLSDLFSRSQRCTYSSFKLDSAILAHKNQCINTTIESPFQSIQVKTINFKKGEKDNVYFNNQELRSDVDITLVEGNTLNIEVIGNFQNNQYEISGTTTAIKELNLGSKNWIFSLYPFVIKKLLDSIATRKQESELEMKMKNIISLEQYDASNQELKDFHDKIIEISQKTSFEAGSMERKIIINYFPNIRSFPKLQETRMVLCKITLAGIWLKQPIKEFSDLYDGKEPAQIFKDICKGLSIIKTKLTPLMQSNKEETVKMINEKFEYIISHQPSLGFDQLEEFFSDAVSVSDIKTVSNIIEERSKIPDIIDDHIKHFLENDNLVSDRAIRRAFIQKVNPPNRYILDLMCKPQKEDKQEKHDLCVLIHLLTVIEGTDMTPERKNKYYKKIGQKIIEFTSNNSQSKIESFEKIDAKLAQMTFAIEPINNEKLDLSISQKMNVTEREICSMPGWCAYNANQLTHLVAPYIKICRTNNKISQQLIKTIYDQAKQLLNAKNANEKNLPKLDDQAYTAMIALGAEIFGPSITRFVLQNGQKKSIKDVQFTDQTAVFEADPPKITVNKDINNLIKTLLKIGFDLDTKDPKEAVKNCIVISFINKIYNILSPSDQFESFNESRGLQEKILKMEYQKCPTSISIERIRSSLRMTTINKPDLKQHMFVNLTFCLKIEKAQIKGCIDTDSFFVYTKSIEDMEGIHFKLPFMKNAIKYIGFVDDNWNTVFLSFFDKTIYTNDNYMSYIGNLYEFTVSCCGQYLEFDNQRVDCGSYEKRWIFVITVADDSPIEYNFTKIKNTEKEKKPKIGHSFNVKAIFPRVCLGKRAELPDFYDVNIENVDSELRKFKIFAINSYSDQYELFDISGHHITPLDTPFSIVMENAMFAHKIGDYYQLRQNHFQNCNNYCLSMLNTMVASSSVKAFSMLVNLTPNSSRQEVQLVISSLGRSKNEIIELINQKLAACDKDNSVSVCSNLNSFNSLMKDYGQYQMAYFNGWYHGILYEKNFDNGVKLFFAYQKLCKGFIPFITKEFQSKIPNDLNMAKLYLRFFNMPETANPLGNVSAFAEYMNNLITFIFERDPSAILFQSGISQNIISCAKSLLPQLYNLGQSKINGAKRIPPLVLYAHGNDVGPKWEKFLQNNNNNFYPMEITRFNDSKSIITQKGFHSISNVKYCRYHFGTNAQSILNDWKEAKEIDFSPCYKDLCEYNLRRLIVPSSLGFNSVVVYFCHIGLSTLKDIPTEFIDVNGPRTALYVQRDRLPGDSPIFYIDITKTFSRTQSYTNSVTVINELSKCPNFPGRLYNGRIYKVYYNEESGIDAGGLFRDTFNIMVTELMDTNFNFFTRPPRTLLCEQECLIPSMNLSNRISYCIGAVLSAAILIDSPHKLWNLPMFMWDYFAAPIGTKLSELVDCTDTTWLNGLEKTLIEMKKGFHFYLPQDLIKNLSGKYLKILAVGNVTKLDYYTFVKYLQGDGPVEVFKRAISDFTPEEFILLLKFITGCETPPIDPNFKIIINNRSQSKCEERYYEFPFAHTCSKSIDVPPYKTPSILRDKLKFEIRSVSTVED